MIMLRGGPFNKETRLVSRELPFIVVVPVIRKPDYTLCDYPPTVDDDRYKYAVYRHRGNSPYYDFSHIGT